MQEIMLVNPARRPKKRASPAQKRARAAFAAASRARSKKAPVMANPRKRRTRTRKSASRHRNPAPIVRARKARRAHSRRRRNPIGDASKPLSMLTPALVGALGATAVNTALTQIAASLPAMLTTGNMAYITQIAAGLGLAMLAPHAGSKKAMVLQMAEGSLTVTLHNAIVNLSGGFGMTLNGNRGGMGVYLPGARAQAAPRTVGVNPAQLGAYVKGAGSPMQMQMARNAMIANAARSPIKQTMKSFNR